MDTTLTLIAAIASAIAAIASVVVAIYVGRRAESVTSALAASERRHASFDTVAEWRRDLREWAAEVIDVLSEATYLCAETTEDSDHHTRIFSCRHRLSSLIDRGRFFLPNIRRDEYGAKKPHAYRGLRHSALDPLVAAERVLSTGTTGRFTDHKHALVAMKREFVSSIQKILDPEGYNQEVARMIREGYNVVGDGTLGGLLPDAATVPLGADAMLQNPPSSHLGLREQHDVSQPTQDDARIVEQVRSTEGASHK